MGSKRLCRMIVPVAALLLALGGSQELGAQTLYGSIVGEVTDATGAAVPAATVVITNKETGLTRQTATNNVGGYSFPNTPTGTYQVEITAQGFTKYTQTDVAVTINSLGGYTEITSTINLGRDGIDERQFRLGLRLSW